MGEKKNSHGTFENTDLCLRWTKIHELFRRISLRWHLKDFLSLEV